MTRFTLLPLLVAIIFASYTGEIGAELIEQPLRVVSFNIRYGTAPDGPNRWGARKKLLAQTIIALKPDLLSTQETLPLQVNYLKNKLSGFKYFGRSRHEKEDNGEQCTVFYRTKRFELVESGHFWLSKTPTIPGSKSWDSSLPRMATWLRLRDQLNQNRQLLFCNTHFDHLGKQARFESARLIHNWLEANAKPNEAIILTGDFNAAEGSKPYQAFGLQHDNRASKQLRNLQLVDTYRATHPINNASAEKASEGTFNGFKNRSPKRRLDWVLTDALNFKIQATGIDRTVENGRFPSDHFPVWAELKWKRR